MRTIVSYGKLLSPILPSTHCRVLIRLGNAICAGASITSKKRVLWKILKIGKYSMTNQYYWLGCTLAVACLSACRTVDPKTLSSPSAVSLVRESSTEIRIERWDGAIETTADLEASVLRGSGNLVSESLEVTPFTQIDCRLGDVEIVQGDRETLTITADDNILPRIIAEVRDRTLYLYPEKNVSFMSSPIRIRVQVRELDGLVVSGSVKAIAENLTTDRFYLEGSGSTQVEIASLVADELQVQMDGSSQLDLSGEVTHQQVQFSGSSEYDGSDLESQTTQLDLSGSSNATVWATRSLDAQLDGSSQVKYYGNPLVSQNVRGGGQLRHLENDRADKVDRLPSRKPNETPQNDDTSH